MDGNKFDAEDWGAEIFLDFDVKVFQVLPSRSAIFRIKREFQDLPSPYFCNFRIKREIAIPATPCETAAPFSTRKHGPFSVLVNCKFVLTG